MRLICASEWRVIVSLRIEFKHLRPRSVSLSFTYGSLVFTPHN